MPFPGSHVGFPKGEKRSTSKRKRKAAKVANIATVYEQSLDRDQSCRISKLLVAFGFISGMGYVELAHLKARGMGGNPDLSRDTTANTIIALTRLHTGVRSLHSGHLTYEFLTDRGADGPMAFTFYEQLPHSMRKGSAWPEGA